MKFECKQKTDKEMNKIKNDHYRNQKNKKF